LQIPQNIVANYIYFIINDYESKVKKIDCIFIVKYDNNLIN